MWTFQCVAAIITTCFITKGCIMTPFSLMPFPHTVCVLLPIHLSLIFSIVLAFLGPAHCRQHNVAEASVTMATTIALAGRCSEESGRILMSKWQETPCYKIECQKEKHAQHSTRVSAPKHAERFQDHSKTAFCCAVSSYCFEVYWEVPSGPYGSTWISTDCCVTVVCLIQLPLAPCFSVK